MYLYKPTNFKYKDADNHTASTIHVGIAHMEATTFSLYLALNDNTCRWAVKQTTRRGRDHTYPWQMLCYVTEPRVIVYILWLDFPYYIFCHDISRNKRFRHVISKSSVL